MKRFAFIIYVAVIGVLITATVLEKTYGTPFVKDHIYGAWWFIAMWALLCVSSIVVLIRRKVYQRPAAMLVHLSLVAILVGAFITHLFGVQGAMHLRKGEVSNLMLDRETELIEQLPFQMRLIDFGLQYYPDTQLPMDYRSVLAIEGTSDTLTVSMNQIGKCHTYRFYQSDYDPDLQGTYLAVSRDPWGIGITYTAYALLFVSLIWMLITDRLAVKGKRMRRSTLFYALFLLACFVLLLTHFMRKYSPETHPLPVLNSRLLPIHVSTIMMAYVLFVILALQSLVALIAHWIAAKGREVKQLSLLSRGSHFNLKLALTLLAIGIMLGAIWANQSWGRYWGWDPKEVWALITLMVYAVPLHAFQRENIKLENVNIGNSKGQRTKVNVECQMVNSQWLNGQWLNGKWLNGKWYYLYLLLAPLSVAITYFGVNFFLGGMHSYA